MSRSLLFVCLGNICRSPLAEGAMRAEALRQGLDLEIDSAGTGDWHVGRPPDHRALAVARRHGIDLAHLRARQVKSGDFHAFDHIFALDPDNLEALRRLAPPDARARLSLLLDWVPGREGEGVVDPYYGAPDLFEAAWRDVAEAARRIARRLAAG